MKKHLFISIIIFACSTEPEDACGVEGGDSTICADCAGVPNGNSIEDNCGVCDGDGSSCIGSCPDNFIENAQGDCVPEQFLYEQSTLQAFYLIEQVTINGQSISSEDWVAAFNNDICVGARQWDLGMCGGGMCDVPVMGNDGNDFTEGYMQQGDIPTFKIYDASENMYYEGILSVPEENCEWSNFNFCLISVLE